MWLINVNEKKEKKKICVEKQLEPTDREGEAMGKWIKFSWLRMEAICIRK